MLQPQKQQSHTGNQAKAPAAAHSASGPAKQPPSMLASAATQQASAHGASGAKILHAPKPTPAGTTKNSATHPSSSAHVGQASTAKQAFRAADAPAVTHRKAAEEGHRASAGPAAQQKALSGSVGRKPGTPAAGQGSAIAGSTMVAAMSAGARKGQLAPLAKGASVSQKPAVRPAAVNRSFPSGHVQPAGSATETAARPTPSVAVPPEAIAAATSFLNDLGNSSSSPSEARGVVPSGPRRPAAGQPGSKTGPALQTQPGQSLPKLPPAPPSPEMRLESLMQELSNMAHRLPNAAPAQPQPKPAAPTAAASRASGSLQQPDSRSASHANVVPLRVSAPPWQPQQSGGATAARSAPAKHGRVPSDAEMRAAEKLRKEIVELQRDIDLKVREAKKKAQAGKAVPQGQKRPDQAPQAAAGSMPPAVAKAKAQVPKASEQPSKGPSLAPDPPSKQTLQLPAAVPGPLAAHGEKSAAAQGDKATGLTATPASAGLSTSKRVTQAAAPVPSPLAASQKQSTVPTGDRVAEHMSKPASGPSTGEARVAPAKANAPAAPKQGSSAAEGGNLPHEQSVGSSVSKGAIGEGTQLSSSSRPAALGSAPPSQAANATSVPQIQRSQPSAAPDAKHPAAKQSATASTPVKPPQKPSMSASLSQKQTDTSGTKPPTTHAQEGPAGSLQQSQRATSVPTSQHGPAQPIVTPASAGKEAVQLAISKDQATAQHGAAAGAANRAAPSQAQPVMSDVLPADDKPKERSARPTAASQSTQPDTHSTVEKAQAGAASAIAMPTTDGSVQAGRPAAPVAKQREHAPSPMLEGSSGKEAPLRLDSAAAPGSQAHKDTPKPARTERLGSLPATGHLEAVPLPVQALEDNTRASSPSSSGTPAYTMLTQTPLGTGSAWPAAAPDKADSQPAPILSQRRESFQLRATTDRLSRPNSARTAPTASHRSVPGPVMAAQRAGAASQTPQASALQGRTPPSSGQRAARGRVMT